MKAKILFLSAAAALASLMVGCKPEQITGNDIEGLKVESSYLQLLPEGGTVALNFTAPGDWKILEEASYTYKQDGKSKTVDTLIAPTGETVSARGAEFASYLTLDKVSGGEGEYSLNVTGPKSDNYVQKKLHLVCGESTQYIMVSQNESVVSPATAAEIIAGPDGKVFLMTGKCISISNTQYGNWYIADETGEIYIYGTVDATGAYNWASFNIAVGDIVTVQGPKTTYGGTVELVDVSVIKVVKSLLAIDQTEFSVGSGATSLAVKAVAKGDNLNFKSDAAWLSIGSTEQLGDTTLVNIMVAENPTNEARKGSVEFTSAAGKDVSTLTVNVIQAGRKGQTPDNPYTVAEAIAAIDAGTAGSADVYVKGIISEINSVDTGKYGNAEYNISDDGTTANQLLVYRGFKFGGAKFVEGDVLGIGWEVVVCGKLTKYGDIYEFAANNYLYSIEGADAEMTVAEAIAYIDSPDYDAARKVIVSGIINKIDNVNLSYGNAQYWISDDGATPAFEVYRSFWFKDPTKTLAGQKFTDEGQIKVGDIVKIVGKVKKYKTTYELDANNYLLVLNGLTE